MLHKQEKQPHSRVKLTVGVSNEQFRKAFEREVEQVGGKVKIQGFRPGKAPRDRIIGHVGRAAIEAGALDQSVSDEYYQAVQEADIVPLHTPSIQITSYTAPDPDTTDEGEAVTFTAEVDILPDFSVDGYKKIRIKTPKADPVTDEEMERTIDYLRKQRAKVEPTEETVPAEKGMWADIGYKGSVNGVAREDMKNEHHPIVIGEGQLIPGFEDEVVGMKRGEEKTFTITFPKDYHSKELAGKKAEFTVTVHDLRTVILPELTDEFSKQFGHDTMEALRTALKDNLKEEKDAQQREQIENLVLEELVKAVKLEVPQSLVEQELNRIKTQTEERFKQMGMTWESYYAQTGNDAEKTDKELRDQADKNVRVGLILGKLIQTEEITDKEKASQIILDKLVEIATGK